MVRNTAREIAIHLSYELNFSGRTPEELYQLLSYNASASFLSVSLWAEDGHHEVVSGPRTTGDGYYESCIVAIEGNQIELTV